MPILTPSDHAFLADMGYLRIPGVIPPENCRAVEAALYEFLEFDPADTESWYRSPFCKTMTGGFIEMSHHQSLWDNRQHPRLYEVFTELHGRRDLFVSMDRASFKIPERSGRPDSMGKSFIHLDVDLPHARGSLGGRFFQGVLYLTDTTPEQGGFHCVPGFHRKLRDWLAAEPDPPVSKPPDFAAVAPTPISGRAGDLVVWDHFLPHGSGRNLSDRPRLAQYVFMAPGARGEKDRELRIRQWRENLPIFGGDPRRIEEKRGKPAELTLLGRKLLGLDPW